VRRGLPHETVKNVQHAIALPLTTQQRTLRSLLHLP
jgi:hypothetical protein